MSRPRLFLSGVSEELRSARRAVAATVRTLGFECVSQDDFPTGYGELRQWLREQIDSCEGLIQLVGHGYGAEPPDVDAEYRRVSYTQFEFLYARHRGKKSWIIVVGEQCRRDKPPEQLDLPRESSHPDPAGYQAERRQLQQDYTARLTRENHLRHNANNDTELQNIVLRLRDELGALRQQSEHKQRRLTIAVIAILLSLVALGAGGWFAYTSLFTVGQQAGVVNTEKIRAHLLQTTEETHRRELAEADAATDWKQRQRLREAADAAHAARLSRIADLATSFAEIEGRGTDTPVFQEMTRILTEQGVDEAIAYVGTQQPAILQTVRARAAAAHESNRADLQPLLKLAALHNAKAQAAEARILYSDILTAEPDWPDALNAAFWFLTGQGDRDANRATLDDAKRNYEDAKQIAQRLSGGTPSNSSWQRALSVSYQRLGRVAESQGKLDDATRAYGESLAITKQLVAGDPSNTEWQRDLSVLYEGLGFMAEAQGRLEDAARAYGDGLAIRKQLVAGDQSNPQWKADLSASYERLGHVAEEQGKLEDAARAYLDGLGIAKDLSLGDPSNTAWHRALSVFSDRLGHLAEAQRKLEVAARAYAVALTIRKHLTAGDPSNTQWQGDLAVSYNNLGEVAVAQGRLDEAVGSYADALAITKQLVAGDPSNTEWQRSLSILYSNLGDVAVTQKRLEDAEHAYADALAITEQLVAGDPSNTEWQRDLSELYSRLATVCEQQNDGKAAQGYRNQAFEVLSQIDKLGLYLSTDDRRLMEKLRRKVSKPTRPTF